MGASFAFWAFLRAPLLVDCPIVHTCVHIRVLSPTMGWSEEESMIVGCPKEIKNEEYRVGMTPNGVKDFVAAGHTVIVEAGAGVGSGFSDKEYKAAGATLAPVEGRLRQGRHDLQGQGAAPGGVADVQAGPDPLHVPAPGRRVRQGPHQGHAQGRHPRYRVRDRRAPQRRPPAPLPDERGRRQAGHPGRRHAPPEEQRRPRRAPRRRDRRTARPRSSSSAAAPWAPTPPRSPWAWARAWS